MRAPYDLILSNPDLDIPFCLHWANEPWTVRWDGLATQKGMLLDQRHSIEDDLAFFRDIEPAVTDPRYMTVDGRPLLIIYRPSLFPDMSATLDRWKHCFNRAGLKEPFMAVMQTGFEGAIDPRKYGFDAAIEYPPHNLGSGKVTERLPLYDPGFEGTIYDYEHTLERALARPKPDYTLFRGIMPDWDCTPRRANADIFINSEPHRYQRWLEGLLQHSDDERPKDHKLTFVNAWNEWAEGAYLEPDRKFGYAYLAAGSKALNSYRGACLDGVGQKILIGAHIFHEDLLEDFVQRFLNIPGRFDVLVTTSTEHREHIENTLQARLAKTISKLNVVAVKNIGRDFAPFVFQCLPAAIDYDLVCWVHSKKSSYEKKYAGWLSYLLDNLLGSPENIQAIVESFAVEPRLGLLYPKAFPPVAKKAEWGSNFELTRTLLKKLNIDVFEADVPVFPTAAMFWFRPAALKPILDLDLTEDDFIRFSDGPRDLVTNQIIDGTLSHALERMIHYVTSSRGYQSKEFQF